MAGVIVVLLIVALIVLASNGDDSKNDKERPGEALTGDFCTPQRVALASAAEPSETSTTTEKPKEPGSYSRRSRIIQDGFGNANCGKRSGGVADYWGRSSLYVDSRKSKKNGTAAGRILGGEEAEPGDEPWFTLIEARRQGSDDRERCGGVWIHQSWILTAAHCLVGDSSNIQEDRTHIEAYVGAVQYHDQPQDGALADGRHIRPDRCLVPTDFRGEWTDDGMVWDIALLHIPNNPESGSVLQPAEPFDTYNTICITEPGPGTKEAQPHFREIAGFGFDESGALPNTLKFGAYQYPGAGSCQNSITGDPVTNRDGIICTRLNPNQEPAPAGGDSGGPVMKQELLNDNDPRDWERYRNVLVGIHSGDTLAKNSAGFRDTFDSDLGFEPYQNWINQVINSQQQQPQPEPQPEPQQR